MPRSGRFLVVAVLLAVALGSVWYHRDMQTGLTMGGYQTEYEYNSYTGDYDYNTYYQPGQITITDYGQTTHGFQDKARAFLVPAIALALAAGFAARRGRSTVRLARLALGCAAVAAGFAVARHLALPILLVLGAALLLVPEARLGGRVRRGPVPRPAVA